MRRTRNILAALLAAAMLAGQGDSERQLEAAIHREVVAGDLKGAIENYRAILTQPGVSKAIAARALFHIGECYEKLGQQRQAHDAYQRVAREFESETSIAAAARARTENWTEVLPGPRNLNFEEGEAGKAPPGWTVLTLEKVTGNLAELRRKGCRSGIGCAVLIAPATAPGQVGNLMQSFSAEAYRGKTVRLRAWLKVEAVAPGDRANMWLQEDRPNGKQGFSADLDERAVRSADWTSCELVGRIHPDAQFLRFGFSSIGHGRVWIDNVSFEVVYGVSN
ncbi:MAG TPA: tetratricopeptide repeat protein [Verrucomicrobiae bacterium]|nr:tetratricopeptide repeat protein [Verrucomicrobiae bacterium]